MSGPLWRIQFSLVKNRQWTVLLSESFWPFREVVPSKSKTSIMQANLAKSSWNERSVSRIPVTCYMFRTIFWNMLYVICLILTRSINDRPSTTASIAFLAHPFCGCLLAPPQPWTNISINHLDRVWPSHLTGPQRHQRHQVPASTAVSWWGGWAFYMPILGLNTA